MQSGRPVVQVLEVTDGIPLEQLRTLFREYGDWLSDLICLSGFADEIASLPGAYSVPMGRLLMATIDEMPAGCVALRPLSEGVGEVKRLYVKESARGTGVGRRLMEAVIESARDAEFRLLRLDSLADRMQPAIALYRRLGFTEIQAYYEGANERKLFFELTLADAVHG